MREHRAPSRLADELRTWRRTAQLTQGELAVRAGLAVRTVKNLEAGRGSWPSFARALDVLDAQVVGRNLPPGDSLGEQLRVLRQRRRRSVRALARESALDPKTIHALEREDHQPAVRLAHCERVLTVLGAGIYLAPRNGYRPAFFTHAGNASVDHGWETPPEILDALYTAFTFDLDPCAPRKARTRVKAQVRWTEDDNGLSLPWWGAVFVNPPYGPQIGRWLAKCHAEWASHRASTVVALVPARTDTKYWHRDVAGTATVFFLEGRLRFGAGSAPAPFPSAVVVWGASGESLNTLKDQLPDSWRVDPERERNHHGDSL